MSAEARFLLWLTGLLLATIVAVAALGAAFSDDDGGLSCYPQQAHDPVVSLTCVVTR